MAGFDPIRTNRGTFRCGYCSHKSWKQRGYAVAHIKKAHHEQAKISEIEAKAAERVRNAEREARQAGWRADAAERKLAEANKPKKEERYDAVVYCPNCQSVDSVCIINGQPIGVGGCFRCSCTGSMRVRQVNVNSGTY